MEVIFFIIACLMFLGNIAGKNQQVRDEAARQEQLDTIIDTLYNESRR